jgi:hypothetical protein
MPVLDFFELLPLPQLFIATLAGGALYGMVVLAAVRVILWLLGFTSKIELPVRDALISSLSALFALMVAFSAAGIWNDAIQARAAVQREANAIENVIALSSNLPDALREEVHSKVLQNARRTIDSDWPAMRHRAGVNEILYDRTNSPLVAIITDLTQDAGGASRYTSEAIIGQILDLRSARLQREMIARGGVSIAQWLAMIVIATGALTVIAIAHNHRRGLQLTAAGIYTFCACAAFFVILAHDRPFVGYLGVKPIPIERAVERIRRTVSTGALAPRTTPNTEP